MRKNIKKIQPNIAIIKLSLYPSFRNCLIERYASSVVKGLNISDLQPQLQYYLSFDHPLQPSKIGNQNSFMDILLNNIDVILSFPTDSPSKLLG